MTTIATTKQTFMARRHDNNTVYVTIDDSRAGPCNRFGCSTCDQEAGESDVEDCGGHDWSNADWPTDAEVAKAAGVQAVRFFDVGETLAEAVYHVVTP